LYNSGSLSLSLNRRVNTLSLYSRFMPMGLNIVVRAAYQVFLSTNERKRAQTHFFEGLSSPFLYFQWFWDNFGYNKGKQNLYIEAHADTLVSVALRKRVF
jgi:hypothetical protein